MNRLTYLRSIGQRHMNRSVIFVLLLPAVSPAAGAEGRPWDAPTPRATFHADFEDAKRPATIGKMSAQRVVLEAGRFGRGLVIAKGLRPGSALIGGAHHLDPRRGSLVFWLKLNSAEQEGPAEILSVYPGPPRLEIGFRAQRPDPKKPGRTKPGEIGFRVDGQRLGSGDLPLLPGRWRHVAWTWWGMLHRVYVDGRLSRETSLPSPMGARQLASLRVGTFAGGKQDVTIDELAIYNTPLTAAEVQATFRAAKPGPLKALAPHGLEVAALWAPGEGKVHVAADAGNQWAARTSKLAIAAVDPNGRTVARGQVASPVRGFGETVLSLGTMTPGRYRVVVRALDERGKELASATSKAYELPRTAWLGNRLGLSEKIQPPWTPVEVRGQTLGVWGRRYRLAGGFGLPQQIDSQGRPLLARPVALEIVQDGKPVAMANPRVRIGPAKPAEATWTGTADAGPLRIEVRGRIEYDGLVLLTMRLVPVGRPAALQAVRLQTAMPGDRARFMHTTTDQTYWWYTYKSATANKPGVFHDNLKQRAGASRFLPAVVFSDHDRGLTWFAENPSGWQVDEARPMQRMIRDDDGTVRLECLLANRPFTLERPIEITFGLMATPVKPLPPHWRTAFVHYAPLAMKSDLGLWWSWPDDAGKKGRQGTFNLCPVDVKAYRQAFVRLRKSGIALAPFTNAHVLLPHPPDDWASLHHVLQAETQNDGWTAQPTRGFRDYWAFQLNRWLDGDGMDAIYIDESYAFGASAALLSGGYVRDDGTHGPGCNLLGVRALLQRTRQLLLDHRKRPLVWLHTTASMWPHAWSFADVVSDGEAFQFAKPGGADWIDLWGSKLLAPVGGPGASGGPWLLSIGRAQKYGFIPIFLNYIKFYNAPEYPRALRSMHALLTLLDIIPITYTPGKLPQIKDDFGIGADDVAFHGYWRQKAVLAERADVKASYYRRPRSALIVVANLGGQPYEGKLRIDLRSLGFRGAAVHLRDPEAPGTPPPALEGGAIRIRIARHDYRLIRLDVLDGGS